MTDRKLKDYGIPRPDCSQCGKPMISRGHKAESGRQRWRCKPCGISTTGSGEALGGYDRMAARARCRALREKIKGGQRRFVITSAQDTTQPFMPFYEALKVYCKHWGAELIVIPVHYKNISLYTAGQEYKKRWDSRLEDHLIDERVNLGGGVVLMGHTSIQATAQNPVSGMDGLEGENWTIFGHSKIMMEPVATPGDARPKRMFTTGSITRKNYSQTKLGEKAKFHHVFGALVVEIDGPKRAFTRQINASHDGSFYELAGGEVRKYSLEGVGESERILALAPGDSHERFMAKTVREQTYTHKDSMLNRLKPKHLFHNDLFDCYFGSHHHEKDPITQYRKFHNGYGNGRDELDRVVDFINSIPDDVQQHLVYSNHHAHLDQWVARANVNRDHLNAHLILELQTAVREAIDKGENAEALPIYLKPRVNKPLKFLSPNAPFMLKEVDYSQHGHRGVNGSRGSAKGLAKGAHKLVIGHGHGARIYLGVYQSGVSTDRLEYESGHSDHSHTHVAQYPSGKRTIIDILNNRWFMEAG